MKTKPQQLILFKIGLLFVPFVILFIIFIFVEGLPADTQYRTLDTKIQKLVIENPKQPSVLITGESRAVKMFMPDIFDDVTRVNSINVAAPGVSLPTAMKALAENKLLDGKHFIVVSVSSYEINDNYISYYPSDIDVIKSEPWGKEKLKHIYKVADAFMWYYIGNFRSFLRFWEPKADTSLSPEVLAAGGYMSNPGQITIAPDGTTRDVDFTLYANPNLNGSKKIEFEKSVETLCRSGAPAVIYLGPTAPAWKKTMSSIAADKVEADFANIIMEMLEPKECSNVHFINFSDHDISSLDNSQFADFVHVNVSGGEIFSRLLGDTLIKKGYLKFPTQSRVQGQ